MRGTGSSFKSRREPASRVAVLASGGLDSCVLIGDLARTRTVVPIYIRQGLAWETVELYWLKQFLRVSASARLRVAPLKIFSLPMADVYGAHWSTGRGRIPGARTRDEAVYLPGRNLILSVKAAVFAAMQGIREIAIGSLDHNPFPDASVPFYRAWSKAVSQGLGNPIRVVAPFRGKSKVEVIQIGRNLPLELTFSCLNPVGKTHCGKCNKCAERRRAFTAAKVVDRTQYAAGPLSHPSDGRG